MTASYGTKLEYTKAEQVSGETTLAHNQYYVVEHSETNFFLGYGMDTAAKERELIAQAKIKYGAEPEVTLVYAEATVYDGGLPGFFYDIHVLFILKCNHPITAALVLAIAAAIVMIVIALTFVFIVWRVDAAAEKLGPAVTILVGLVIIVIIAVILITVVGGKVGVKGKGVGVTAGK